LLKRKFFGRIDYLTLLITAVILVFGLVSISSAVSSVTTDELSIFDIAALANTESASLQLIFYAVGLLAVAVILLIDYNNLRDFSDLFYWAAVALLVLVLFFGREINGTAGWFVISGRGFQPSEYGKVVIIIVLAAETAKVTQNKESGIDSFTAWQNGKLLWQDNEAVSVTPIHGEDLQGIYWGVQALIPYETMLRIWPDFSFAAGETIRGNIFKTCDDPKWEHYGSFFPADFTLEQPYVPENFGEFLLVNY